MSQVITGDAVVLDLRIAKLSSRALAQGIDMAVQGVMLFLLVILAAVVGAFTDEAAFRGLSLLVTVGVLLGYPVLFETLTRGHTLGKLALGLRTVREDAGPIRFRHALVRGLLEVVEIWFLSFLCVLASLISPRGRRLGDVLAGTLVIRERAPVRPVGPVGMPPGLGSWAEGLDLSRLSQHDALQTRQLLGRWKQLDVGARGATAQALAVRVQASVQPDPPPGTPPASFLAAVMAERHRRELVRLDKARAATRPPSHPAGAPGWGPPTG